MSDIKRKITEEQDVHEEWYRARPETPAELAEFVRHLVEDYEHDYGTICHAVAAAALAAARTVTASPTGDITGFQASAAMWEFISKWMHDDSPMRLLRYEDFLFPQYKQRYTEIPKGAWEWMQKRAKQHLAQYRDLHADVFTHMKSIVEGKAPFGFTIERE